MRTVVLRPSSRVTVQPAPHVVQVPSRPSPPVGARAWQIPFGVSGPLTIKTGALRVYLDAPGPATIATARAFVTTSPVGADVIFTVKKNGSPAFTLTVPNGGNTALRQPATALVPGDYLTVDVTQVGSSSAGADATVVCTLQG